jgi:acyl-CoA hydrolase
MLFSKPINSEENMANSGKTVATTAVSDHIYPLFPNDLNSQGTAFGGLIMSILDRVASVVAARHSEHVCVTASVDAMHFLAPAKQGDTLVFQASVNRAWKTSMEIGTKVLAENSRNRQQTHILSAYFTFVALDGDKKPTIVLPVIPETVDEKRRYEEADIRRQTRIQNAAERKIRRQT